MGWIVAVHHLLSAGVLLIFSIVSLIFRLLRIALIILAATSQKHSPDAKWCIIKFASNLLLYEVATTLRH
jgi:hypothetical protein